MSSKDLIRIEALQIKTVLDFRGRKESNSNKYKEYSRIAKYEYSKPIETKASVELYNLFITGKPTEKKVKNLMIESYKEYAIDFVTNYKFLLNLLTEKKNLPLVFHCTAGKDRTGFATALIFFCLNISYDDVKKDYLLTNRFWKTTLNLPNKVSKSSVRAMLKADIDYLNSALNAVQDKHKDIDTYLIRELKIDRLKRKKIRSNLLEKTR
tara:strand:- start:6 stop:635 length:630 start_codon:yes stop_codon:yes gene_type:complete